MAPPLGGTTIKSMIIQCAFGPGLVVPLVRPVRLRTPAGGFGFPGPAVSRNSQTFLEQVICIPQEALPAPFANTPSTPIKLLCFTMRLALSNWPSALAALVLYNKVCAKQLAVSGCSCSL